MSKTKQNKLARRHLKYALLAYAIIGILLLAAIVRPSQILIWTAGVLIVLTVIATRYHAQQDRVRKDTVIEYVLVLIAALVVLFGALRH
jgi:NADH:ubiquinone oxidoreductase subunit 6 (subunit J)